MKAIWDRAWHYQGCVARGHRHTDRRPGHHAPIITEEQFRADLAGVEARKRGRGKPPRSSRRRYLLRGLVRRAVTDWLRARPNDVVTLLAGVAGRAQQISPQYRITQRDFDAGAYRALGSLTSPAAARAAIRAAAPGVRVPKSFPDLDYVVDVNRGLIEQFLWLHAKARQRQKQRNTGSD